MQQSAAISRKYLKGDRDKATTNEMRYDWLADRWVIIAPQRTARPDDFVQTPLPPRDASNCPFCEGNEYETPDPVATFFPEKHRRGDLDRPWAVRVVPNKFPAVNFPQDHFSFVDSTEEKDAGKNGSSKIDLFQRRDFFGAHEVVIESPNHVQSLTDLNRESIKLVFEAYRDRLSYWLHKRQCAYAVLFKNVGQDAGASLAHSHSQLIATDVLPTKVGRTIERMQLFESEEGQCLHCRMVADELENKTRVVETTPDFIAFCPFASRTPSLVTVTSQKHQSRFELLDDFELEQLSWLMHRLIRRIEKCYPDSAYNFVIHTSPSRSENPSYFHWRLELFPRLTKVAGFEWGSDCYINPLTPEDAAHNLRQAGV